MGTRKHVAGIGEVKAALGASLGAFCRIEDDPHRVFVYTKNKLVKAGFSRKTLGVVS
jgi:hypothetical protein